MATKIQIRRDTSANWASANPTLAQGEMAFETDTLKVKIGDGLSAFNALAYALSLNYNDLSNTPTELPPSAHTHDDIYYTEAEVDSLLAAKAELVHTHDFSAEFLDASTTTSLVVDNPNTQLIYTDTQGNANTIDLSMYVDDTNLAYIVSGSVDGSGQATFTRSDATTFTVDMTALLQQDLSELTDNTNILDAKLDKTGGDITGNLDVSGNFETSYINIPNFMQTITNPTSTLLFHSPVEFKGFKETIFQMGNVDAGWTPQPTVASVFVATLTGTSFQFLGFASAEAGQTLTLILKQDSAGNRPWSADSGLDIVYANGDSTLSTDPNSRDIINIFYDGTTYYVSMAKGYA